MEISVTLELALQHGLNEEEYNRILEVLGRTPTYAELGVFSVMWSEHCCYKNSIAELKKLPRKGPRTLVEAKPKDAAEKEDQTPRQPLPLPFGKLDILA